MKPKLIKSAKRTAPLRAISALNDRTYYRILELDRTWTNNLDKPIPRPWMRPWSSSLAAAISQYVMDDVSIRLNRRRGWEP